MNVASLELCRELYELSGWDDVDLQHTPVGLMGVIPNEPGRPKYLPAYVLGYLLRKLPETTQLRKSNQTKGKGYKPGKAPYLVSCCRLTDDQPTYYWGKRNVVLGADTPEDAACKLAIELFKKGILTKESPKEGANE